MNILFLSTDDFYTTNGTKGKLLCNTISGFSLVLFFSNKCPHSREVLPVFNKLPGTIGGCQFGTINVSTNKDIIAKSSDTITAIKYVPYIILYVNGKPFMLYQGPNTIEHMQKFIVEVSKKINNRQEFSSSEIKQKSRIQIPNYTIGIPKCDDEILYYEFEEAY